MARVYVDENLGREFIEAVVESRHEVLLAGDIGQARTDVWHFREAVEQERVLLTLDKRDYQYFHRLWTTLRIMRVLEEQHAGILVAVQPKGFAQLDWLPALHEKLGAPEPLRGRLWRWRPPYDWHEDDWKPED